MAYVLHISERDRKYLTGLPLSDHAKARLEDFIDYAIRNVDDAFRNDPNNRPQANGPFFQRDFLLIDKDGNGHYHLVVFVVDDSAARYGVLLLVYVEHRDCGA